VKKLLIFWWHHKWLRYASNDRYDLNHHQSLKVITRVEYYRFDARSIDEASHSFTTQASFQGTVDRANITTLK
jgi:hypothetical protein